MEINGYLIDTNIFNHIVEEKIKLEDLPKDASIFVTHLQYDEIQKCENQKKREKLLQLLKELPHKRATLETIIAGVARAGECRVGNGKIYEEILRILNKKNKRKNVSNTYDALIGEVAILNKFILITHDQALAKAVIDMGGKIKKFPWN